MSFNDYKRMQKELITIKEIETLPNGSTNIIYKDINKIEYLKRNINYINKFKTCMNPILVWNVINRPIFYYTMMRQDIFFIECKLENGQIFYFATNEKSFWKRFEFVKNKEFGEYYQSFDYYITDFLYKLINNGNFCTDIKLKILPFEEKLLKEYYDAHPFDGKHTEPFIKLTNNMPIKILNYVYYSKRLWLEVLDEYDFSDSNNLLPDHLKFKFPSTKDDQTIENNNFKDYFQFIQ